MTRWEAYTGATWNPITGCSVKSAGCTNCYAMQLAGTRLKNHGSRAGLTRQANGNHVWNGKVRFNDKWVGQPLRWQKPRMIFVCAHGDLFHENVPDEWIDRVFAVMALSPQHTFQVLTKRVDRMRDYCRSDRAMTAISSILASMSAIPDSKFRMRYKHDLLPGFQLPNVWLGVSVEDQAAADERIPALLDTPAALRFVSAEPLLGPVDLNWLRYKNVTNVDALRGRHGVAWGADCNRIDWVIVGGESGKDARPMHPDWARDLRDQCAAAEVPFFFKQWGEWYPCVMDDPGDPEYPGMRIYPSEDHDPFAGDWQLDSRAVKEIAKQEMVRVGKKMAGRLLDGVEHNAMPALQGTQEKQA